MAKENGIEIQGTIKKAMGNSLFCVELDNDHEILAYPCGKMRKYFIRIMPGDKVTVEISPYDMEKGRITYRHK